MKYERGGEPAELAVRTKEFSLRLIRMYSALPKTSVARVLGEQILRSGTSVGANCREAKRARSRAEFIPKLGECLRELDETAYWLDLPGESRVLPPAKLSALSDECNQLLAIFTTISKKSKQSINDEP
jgi:four helix bundle protein